MLSFFSIFSVYMFVFYFYANMVHFQNMPNSHVNSTMVIEHQFSLFNLKLSFSFRIHVFYLQLIKKRTHTT